VYNQLENIAGLRTEGHSHSDLSGTLANKEGDDTVDADDSEDEGESRKGAEERGDGSRRGHATGQNDRHGPYFSDGCVFAQRGCDLAERFLQLQVVLGGTHDQSHFRGNVSVFEAGSWSVREVHSSVHPWRYASLQIVGAHVGGDADDGAPIFLSKKAEMLSNGILIWEKTPRGFRAEDGDAGISRSICLGEFAAAQKRNAHRLEITGRNSVHPQERLGDGRGREIVFDIYGALLHSSTEGKRAD
jgi:hypothetical protein